ncbi:MAG: DUF1592 domain-containing protein [Myxococcota bacterium]
MSRSVAKALFWASCVWMGSACVTATDEPSDPGTEPPPLPDTVYNFECDASASPSAIPLRRLSAAQHRLATIDFVRDTLPAHSEDVIQELQPAITGLVPDIPEGPEPHFARLSRLDQLVSQGHVDRGYDLATAVGASLTQPGRLQDLAGSCAPASVDCVRSFVQKAAPLAWRRPVEDAEVTRVLAAIQADPVTAADWADVVTLMLLSPEHLYLVETVQDTTQTPPALTAISLANRMSFHFWQRPPDEELRALAESGELLDDNVYKEQVERLFKDERTKHSVREFFSEWLGNTALEELDSRVGAPVYEAFRGDTLPGPDLKEHMLDEVTDSIVWTTFDQGGTWDDVLTSDRSFARTQGLADIYDTPVWDGVSEPPLMTQEQRAGLVTRAAYLATGSANTRPIMKGVLLRTALLCDEIGSPPDNAANNPPDLPEDISTRQFVENLTGSGSCSFCHEKKINPLGFVTEDFDALGRPRSTQKLFDSSTGEARGEVPIDTFVKPYVVHPHETAANAHDITALFVASPKPRACLTRHWFRFTFGRMEDEAIDGCALEPVDRALADGESLADALLAIAMTPDFRHRDLGGQ